MELEKTMFSILWENLRKAKRSGWAIFLALAMVGCARPGPSPPPSAKVANDAQGKGLSSAEVPKASSPASAQVVIEAYYPFNEKHQFIADYLRTLPKKYGPDVSVELIDMESEEGHARWEKTGLSCGGVFVNGKTSAILTKEGKPLKAHFLGRMDVQWQRSDLEKAIEQELERAEGGKK